MTPLTICLIICVLTMISYVWGKLPMALTAMLSMVAFILTGCLDPKTALGYFGNTNGIMIVAMFVVAAGFTRTQFVKKCAASVNGIAKGSLMMVMLGYVLVTALLAQFIQSSVIVFGIMAPMMIASCEELNISPSKTLFPLSIVSIATISALPLGSGATQAAELNGYLEANGYTDFVVALTDPMKARLPMLIAVMIYCIFFATRFAPNAPVVKATGIESRKDNKEPLSPFKERAGYFVFILTTIALILQPQLKLETWVICLTGALSMVLFGVLTEREAIAAINWPMAFLFVGALSMGGALTETGAGEVIGGILAGFANRINNPYIIGFVFFIVPFLLTQVMMNRTVMIIFIPIAILACKAMGANPVGIIILVQAACLSSFMTPMATPAVPMCMASGGMMTSELAIRAPWVFAAVAPWSAIRNPDLDCPPPERIDPVVPYLFLFGENDWLCVDREKGQLEYHAAPDIAAFLENLMRIYQLDKAPRRYVCGEICYYVYQNAKGVPLLIVGTVKEMSHANYPRESWISYDEFMAKFSRRADGTLLYMGEPVI